LFLKLKLRNRRHRQQSASLRCIDSSDAVTKTSTTLDRVAHMSRNYGLINARKMMFTTEETPIHSFACNVKHRLSQDFCWGALDSGMKC